MKRLSVLSLVVAVLALAVPSWGYTPPGNDGSLDQDCDVSLDGQAIVTKKLTITQYRYDDASTDTRAHFEPKARADAETAKNDLNKGNEFDLGDDPVFMDDMRGSFKDFCGIGESNQSAGNMNNQNNVVGASAGVEDLHSAPNMVAMSGSELVLTNTCNEVKISNAVFTNSMEGFYKGFTGIGQSNQSAGNMNNQSKVVSFR